MLVVLAVIALLTGLLLPALGRARELSRGAVCASNLRQLALANDLYAADHADRLAPGAPDIAANLTRWHGARSSAGTSFSPGGGTLSRYLAGDGSDSGALGGVRACPTFAPTAAALGRAKVGFERGAGGYGYNNAFAGTDRRDAGIDPGCGRTVWMTVTDRLGSPRSRFTLPARTVGFADAAFADGNGAAGVIEFSFAEPRFWPDSPQYRADPSIHFRHARRANLARLDGHVASDSMTFTWSSGFYSAKAADFGIGWPGEDSNAMFEYR